MYGDRLILAETLIVVLEAGSFTDAAEKLGVSQSTVSRRIAALEEKLGGAALFHRGTRWIEPTLEADEYVRDVRSVIGQLEAAEAKIRDLDATPRGLVRLSLPPAIARAKLISSVSHLVERYPELTLRIELSEDYVDLRDGSVDLAVRIRPLQQTGIVNEKIGETPVSLFGSPEYLANAPLLETVADLANHRVIGLASFFERDLLTLSRKKQNEWSNIRPQIIANDLTAIRTMLLDGLGVGLLPELVVDLEVEGGLLTKCSTSTNLPTIELYALYPHGLRRSPRLVAVMESLRAAITGRTSQGLDNTFQEANISHTASSSY